MDEQNVRHRWTRGVGPAMTGYEIRIQLDFYAQWIRVGLVEGGATEARSRPRSESTTPLIISSGVRGGISGN